MQIQSFEDIEAWKKARELNKKIYMVFGNSRDFSFRDQIQRASVSVTSNIAEGFDRKTNKEFLYLLSVAKWSASEVRSLLYLALDVSYISAEQFDELYALIDEVSRLLYWFINYLDRFEKQKHITHNS